MAVLLALLGVLLASPASAVVDEGHGQDVRAEKAGEDTRIPGHYIVVFEDSVKGPSTVAHAQTRQRDGELGLVYRSAIKGYSAKLSKGAVQALRHDPRVKYVTPDHRVETFAQTVPTGIERIYATENASVDIDEEDDVRIDVDVAVIDTGVRHEHPDLNVAGRTNCVPPGGFEEEEAEECVDNAGVDGHGHGTHVAGTIGALDNGFGVVGVAPGARIWGVRVLNNAGEGSESWIIAAVDWVSATREDEDPENDIEVANMSLGCKCSMPALDEAISASVENGVVYAVSAGNSAQDVKHFSPASSPDVIAVSALADYDGKAGGEAEPTCSDRGDDDTLANFSNYGEGIEIAAPGVCILSTVPGGGYGKLSGTSMASPHVAGAAALLASESSPESKEDAEAIRDELIEAASLDWADPIFKGAGPTPLLYAGDTPLGPEAVTTAPSVGVTDATLHGALAARGLETEYQFEYGETTSYGESVPVPAGEVAEGSTYAHLEEEIDELLPGARYHYRLVATNEEGTFESEDRTFKTEVPRPTFSFAFGKAGSGNGELEFPTDIEIDPEGDVWVLDTSNMRIQQFDAEGKYLSQFGKQGTGKGEFVEPTGIAIDAEGDVWVLDSNNSRVQQFTNAGEFLSQFGKSGSGTGEFGDPQGIAIDAGGDIWVLDTSGSRIQQFTAEGEYLNQFGEFGSGNGEFLGLRDIAIDAEGDIWVVDVENSSDYGRIQQFTAEGEYLNQFGEFGSDNGEFFGPQGIAIDAEGDVWVTDGWNSRIQQFTAEGEYLNQFGEYGFGNGQLELPMGAVIDSDGNIWITEGSRVQKWTVPPQEDLAHPIVATKPATGTTLTEATLQGTVNPKGLETEYEFEYGKTTSYGNSVPIPAEAIGDGQENIAVSEEIEGLESETTYHYRLVATNQKGTRVGKDRTFKTIPAPGVQVKAAAGVSGLAATLQGTVDPKGFETTFTFQWGKTTSYGNSVHVPPQSVGEGAKDVAVEETIVELQPETTYHFRVVASNEGGTTKSADMSFTTTAATPPVALTDAATPVGAKSATLRGTVNPKGLHASYYFEYGKTTSYGSKVPTSAKGIGSGSSNVAVSEAIGGLEPETTYHFRVVAANTDGFSHGEDRTFTTAAPTPPVAQTETATGIGKKTAILAATIDPEGTLTTYQFEYGKTTSYGSKVPASPKGIGSGTEGVKAYEGISGLEPETTYHFRVVAASVEGTTHGEDRTFTTVPLTPDVQTERAIELDGETATLTGWVNPEGLSTTYYFEYGVEGAEGGTKAPASPKSVGSGTSNVPVSEEVDNLEPGATYYFRLVATNSKGTSYGEELFFTPVATERATSVNEEGATLNGIVNPDGVETEYWFEYGTTTEYGQSTEAKSAGYEYENVEVSEEIEGLESETTYHFRVVAYDVNEETTRVGEDMTFTTGAPVTFAISGEPMELETEVRGVSNDMWLKGEGTIGCDEVIEFTGTVIDNESAQAAIEMEPVTFDCHWGSWRFEFVDVEMNPIEFLTDETIDFTFDFDVIRIYDGKYLQSNCYDNGSSLKSASWYTWSEDVTARFDIENDLELAGGPSCGFLNALDMEGSFELTLEDETPVEIEVE